jgi:DNA replication protein DnaC
MTTSNDDLEAKLTRLKLYYLAKNLADFVARATKKRLGALEILEEIARLEIDEAKRRGIQSRLSAANLGRYRPMADFDWTWPKRINRDAIERLFTLVFLEEPANVILMGPAGVGKTMIAKNLAYQAALGGHTVLFEDASKMLTDLGQQDSPRALEQRMRRYVRPRLLVIDEVGYLSYSTRAADLMFQVVSRRYEHGATILSTNVPFKEWGTIFPGAACASVMIDRLTHHAEIQLIDGDSYRKKESSERPGRRKPKAPEKPHGD